MHDPVILDYPELRFALDVVRQAARLVCAVQQEMVSPALSKQDRSPVTVADFAAQAFVAYRLAEVFPDIPLVGEENSAQLQSSPETLAQVTHFVARLVPTASPESVCAWIDRGDSGVTGRFWTLDPVDGTKGFLRGGQYAVALALVVDGAPQTGVLGCPNLTPDGTEDMTGPGALFAARRGAGSFGLSMAAEDPTEADLHRLHVTAETSPRRARLLRSFEAGHTNVALLDEMAARLDVQAEALRMDSQAKYAVLAAGKGEAIVRLLSPDKPGYKEKIWDHGAGSLVVEEAGGRLSDLDGKPLDFTAGRSLIHNRGLLVTNGSLHPAFLETLRALGA